jgi:hypothetical protein
MAKPVKLPKNKEFTFTPAGGGGGVSKYPWDEWFNGELLMLERDELNEDGTTKVKKDYDVDTNTMPAKIKTAARKRYKVVQISKKDHEGKKLVDSLIIKSRDMDSDERAAEDVLRAEEKQAREEAKADEKASANGAATEHTATASAS